MFIFLKAEKHNIPEKTFFLITKNKNLNEKIGVPKNHKKQEIRNLEIRRKTP